MEEPLLFDEPVLRDAPDDFELPREALLDFALLLEPREALAFEPLDFELLPRDALAFDELPALAPRDAAPLLLAPARADTLRLTDEEADFAPREAEALLLLFDEALPFADDALFFELPLLLLDALPALRAGADFFDDDPALFELFDDEALFFELPLLFLDDDDADFLEAIWFSFS